MERLRPFVAKGRILVIDDELANLRLFRRILEREGCCAVHTLSSGHDVERVIEEFNPDLILLDLHMPPPDGFEILQRLGDAIHGPMGIPVLMLTGDATKDSKRTALSLGAREFLSKPFDAAEALLRIGNMIETRFLHRELAIQNVLLETRVSERTSELQQSQNETLERLARASEVRDDETGRHTQRVGELSAAIAWALGLGQRKVELITRAAPLHDVGKLGIPDAILLKPGPLTPEETAMMRTHTTAGARILSGGRSELMQMAEQIALSHHERWDGDGYPHKLRGEEIPIEARIVALADCVDALTHNRPYRESRSMDYVIVEVKRCSGSHFDPAVVNALMRSGALTGVVVSPPKPWPVTQLRTPPRGTASSFNVPARR